MSDLSIQDNNKEEKEHFDQFKSALDTLKIEYEFQKNNYVKEFEKMKETINSKNCQIEEYKSKYNNIINENKQLKSLIISLKNTIKSLEQQIEKFKTYQNNIMLKQTEIRNYFDLDVNKAISNIDYIIKKELPKTTKVNCNLEQIKQFDLEKVNERIEKENKKNTSMKENSFDNLYQQRERNEFFYKCKKKMNPIDYANLISVVKLSNSNSISKNEIFIRITNILEPNYPEISNLFKKLFSPVK